MMEVVGIYDIEPRVYGKLKLCLALFMALYLGIARFLMANFHLGYF